MNAVTTKRHGRKDNTPAHPGQAQPATQPKEGEKAVELTLESVQKMVSDSVTAAIKGLPEQIVKLIPQPKAPETPPASPGEKSMSKEDVGKIVDEAVKKATDDIRRANKFQQDGSDANHGHQIEIPCAWTKGNLPLHAKQLLNVCLLRPMNEGIDQKDLDRGKKLSEAMMAKYQTPGYQVKTAMTSTGSNVGDELVPTDLSAEINRRMYLSNDLVAALAPDEIDMPTNPYIYPLLTTRPTFTGESVENTAATEDSPATSNFTLTAKKFMALCQASYELEADSIVPVLREIETSLGEAAGATWESVLINGDTTATHQDSDTNNITKAPEKLVKGLRKLALAVTELKSDLATGGISAANLRAMIKALGKWGVNPRDLLWVVGVKGKNDILGLTEVLTADKVTAAYATILTGKLDTLFGIPIITSAACRENLNASGVYDGSTVTKGSILLFHRREFRTGRRGEFMIETQRAIKAQTHEIVGSFRKALTPRETPSSTISTVVCGYNYTA